MPQRYSNYRVPIGGSPLPGLMDFNTYLQQQEAYKQRLALQQQRQQATQSRQEIMQREAMNRALLMQQIKQQEAAQARQEKYPFAAFQSGLSAQNTQQSQASAHEYAKAIEMFKSGLIGPNELAKKLADLQTLPAEEAIKSQAEVGKAQQMVPIEVQKARQTQEATGPLKTKEALAEAEGKSKIYNPQTDPWNIQLKNLNNSLMDLKKQVAGATQGSAASQIGLNESMWISELTNAALNSNDPTVKKMIQDLKIVSEGKPADFRQNLASAMKTFIWPEYGNVDDKVIDPLMKNLGGRAAIEKKLQQSDIANQQQMIRETIPGPWGDNFRKMGPLPTPGPGSQLDQTGMPGQMAVPATKVSSAGFVNPRGDFSADPNELAILATTGKSLSDQWKEQSDQAAAQNWQKMTGQSPEDQWTQRKNEIASRSQDRNNVLSTEGIPPVGSQAQAPQPQPDFGSLTATGQPPEKSDTYYQMLAYLQAEEEKKQREMDGRPPYDQWAEAPPQDQFVPGYSSLEG